MNINRVVMFTAVCVLAAPAAFTQSWSQTTSADFNANTNSQVKVSVDRVHLGLPAEDDPSEAFSPCSHTFASPSNNLSVMVSDGTYYYNGHFSSSTVNVYGTGYNGTTRGTNYGSFSTPTYSSGQAYVPATNKIYFLSRSWGGGGTTTISEADAAGPSTSAIQRGMPTGGPTQINLISASEDYLLMCYGTRVDFIDTETWTSIDTVNLSSRPRGDIYNYGASFAFDGSYFYFTYGYDGGTSFLVYDLSGNYINRYYDAAYYIHGCFYDWMIGQYISSDGFGTYQCGTVFGPDGGSDSNPMTREFYTSGTTITPDIEPDPFGAWGILEYEVSLETNTTITVDVLDSGNTPILTDVASGTDLNLAGVSEYPIRLRANLSSTSAAYSPFLLDWTVNYIEATPTPSPTATSSPTPTATGTPPPIPATGPTALLLLLAVFGLLLHRRRR